MNKRDLEQAIEEEVAEWPGVKVEFVSGGKHPKAKLTFTPEGGEPLMLSRPYPGTPSDSYNGLHKCLGDMRRVMKQLGAERAKPEPSKEETEARYHKPNDGADRRPDPVQGEKAEPRPDVADQLVTAGVVTEERVEAARSTALRASVAVAGQDVLAEPDPEAEQAERLAALRAQVDAIEDGIYFGLPEEVYHAVPRLSASGLQRLCVSPATFWRGSWLDPDRPEEGEDETKARIYGRAYHVARLEPHRFDTTYVRELDKADFPAKGFISSDEKVKAALKARGCQQTVSGETAADRAQRLIDDGYEGTVFPLEKARWEVQAKGRIPLPAKVYDQIVIDMERVRKNPDIAELLIDGEAEVSIFWTDRHGLKMKARVDYLTREWWDDFKTFANPNGKELTQALSDAVRYNRYHVQAVTYRDAIEEVRLGKVQIRGEASDEQRALIAAIQMRPDELACFYIFQEKGGIPNLLAKEFPFYTVPLSAKLQSEMMVRGGMTDQAGVDRVAAATRTKSKIHRRANLDIDRAKRSFALHSEVYPPGEPWFPIEAVGSFEDYDFNSHWLDEA